jgi:photosystem II stability/assembly factor-like uncharacterized protein
MKLILTRLAVLFFMVAIPLFVISEIAAQSPLTPIQTEITNTGNGRWSWQHPQPQGNELRGIDCPTEKDCYAGGSLGYFDSSANNRAFIIASKDGNKTWSGQELTGHGINKIHCISASACYAASFFGHVLKTTDSGQNWSVLVTNTNENLWGIYCFNANNCIAVGNNGVIQETVNGGLTWLTRTSNTMLALNDITCINASLCLIAGGSGMYGTGDGIILRSQNGGDSWQTVTTQGGNILNGIACFDAATCITVGWGGVIQVSKNAGNSWRSATAHTTSILTDIECPASDKCFLTSSDGQMYYSNDGFIWLEIDIQNEASLSGISCPSAQQCTVAGDNGYLLTTIDGGINWKRHTQGTITSKTLWICYDSYCHIEYTNRINDLECFANGRCLAVSHTGLLFHGDTMNATWSTSKINTSQNLLGLSCLEGQTTNTCYIVGSGGTVWKSVDSGISWQANSTGRTTRFFDIDCATNSICIAVGEDGSIIKTSNGGTNWQTLASTTTQDLFVIECPSATQCIAVGNQGEVLYTNNGGQSWHSPTQPPSLSDYGELGGISCQSVSTCLIVGRDWPPNRAALFRTMDGGANWIPGSIDLPYGLNDITCTPSGFCTAVGNMGIIVHSEDAGDTWQVESSGTTWPLLNVSCLDDGSCFTGGEQGIILGAAVWPEISVSHSFSGSSFAHNVPLVGKIEVVNLGAAPAQQVNVTNTLPLALQSGGPMIVSWESESVTINSPVWPDILSGLNITLTPGTTLSIHFPLTVTNPQKEVKNVTSRVEVDANGLPRPVETEASITLAQYAVSLPLISTTSPNTCYGPYIDNFTSNTSGWPSGDTGRTVYGYMSGEYGFLHTQADEWFAVTRRDLWQSDLLLKLDGYQLANSGLWGLLFGLNNDWSSFYTFEILPNYQKWYVFNFNSTNGWSQVATGNIASISIGQGKNNLLIQGANNKMYFYINNYLVYEMDEKQGYVGLTGGSFADNTHLRYDDYLFHKNTCSAVGPSLLNGVGMLDSPVIFSTDHALSLQNE